MKHDFERYFFYYIFGSFNFFILASLTKLEFIWQAFFFFNIIQSWAFRQTKYSWRILHWIFKLTVLFLLMDQIKCWFLNLSDELFQSFQIQTLIYHTSYFDQSTSQMLAFFLKAHYLFSVRCMKQKLLCQYLYPILFTMENIEGLFWDLC